MRRWGRARAFRGIISADAAIFCISVMIFNIRWRLRSYAASQLFLRWNIVLFAWKAASGEGDNNSAS